MRLFGRARVIFDNLMEYGGEAAFNAPINSADGAQASCHDVFTNRQHGKISIPFRYKRF